MNKEVIITEVGPRDGLQNEKKILETEDKFKYISMLIESQCSSIEVTSFVSTPKIPQMNDGMALFQKLRPFIEKNNKLKLMALVPNVKGFEHALSCGVQDIAIFTATSNTFNLKNINATIDESKKRIQDIMSLAHQHKIRVRGYISTVFGCPYEGETKRDVLKDLTTFLLDQGVDEISFGDTIGVAHPHQVESIVNELLKIMSIDQMVMHFHDTYGMALVNVFKSYQLGIYRFDSSSGGLGGCPYAKVASGNVATEELLHLFQSLGIKSSINAEKVLAASTFVLNKLEKNPPSKLVQAKFNQEQQKLK